MSDLMLSPAELELIADYRRAHDVDVDAYRRTRYVARDLSLYRELVISGCAAPFWTRGPAPPGQGAPSYGGGDGEILFRPGAFVRAIRSASVDLLVHHAEPSIATTSDQSLCLWEGYEGLMFRMNAPGTRAGCDVLKHAQRGDFGSVSVGWLRNASEVSDTSGLRSYTTVDLYEVSLLPRSAVPRFAGTWLKVMSLAESYRLEAAKSTRVQILTPYRLTAGDGWYGRHGGDLPAGEVYTLPVLFANGLIQKGFARALKG